MPFIRYSLVTLIATFALLELGIRTIPYLASEPTRSFILEAERIPLSNTRTFAGFHGGTTILLPETSDKDILALGDSFAFGTYERSEDTWASVLGDKLHRSVVNLGVGSQAPPEYNRMLEVGYRYHPKLVVYAVYANDFLYPENFQVRKLSTENTFKHLEGDDGLFKERLDFTDKSASVIKRFTNLSLTFQLFKLFQQPLAKRETLASRTQNHFFMFPKKAFWDGLVSWNNPAVKRGVEINALLAEEAQRFASGWGAKFVVLLLPSKEMIYGPMAGEREAVFDDAYLETYRQFYRQLISKNIETIDATHWLSAKAMEGQNLFHSIDAHLNIEGNRRVAELIEDTLR